MVKPEWGVKRVCPNCNSRFYDLGKDPVTCPMCASSYPLEELLKVRKTRITKADAKKAAKKAVAPKPEVDEEEEDDVILDNEDVTVEDDLADFSDDDTLLEDDDDNDLDGFQVDSDDENDQ